MTYFTPEHHQACRPVTGSGVYPARAEALGRLVHLQQRLANRLRVANFDLHPFHAGPIVGSVSDRQAHALSVQFMRAVGPALTVERLMGREGIASVQQIVVQHHPSLELRLQPDHFVVELIVPSEAWWDQQNISGKLRVQRQRLAFFSLLQSLDADFCLGFWQGAHLSELHLEVRHLQKTDILHEWLSTFEPSKDHFRLGRWYGVATLPEATIEAEVLRAARGLYAVYEAILWTSENNYREAHLQAISQLSPDKD
ncbi:MAG: hypothetical protein NZ750_05870 [Anaerolineae bacterium]|nr:hypothetical protein [Anaerolineae bacterium]MDW8172974.1 hypothetical protein [Anaerolineae bacterium]